MYNNKAPPRFNSLNPLAKNTKSWLIEGLYKRYLWGLSRRLRRSPFSRYPTRDGSYSDVSNEEDWSQHTLRARNSVGRHSTCRWTRVVYRRMPMRNRRGTALLWLPFQCLQHSEHVHRQLGELGLFARGAHDQDLLQAERHLGRAFAWWCCQRTQSGTGKATHFKRWYWDVSFSEDRTARAFLMDLRAHTMSCYSWLMRINEDQ